MTLVWHEAETNKKPHPCYEAEVPGGKYRAAPVEYINQPRLTFPPRTHIGYEAFFIPDGAKSAADVRNIAQNI